VQWTDWEPTACRAEQDEWYAQRTYAEWARAWDAYAPHWRRPLERAERNMTVLTRALLTFSRDDYEQFEHRSAELFKKRVSVSYMLPAGSGGMDQFYQQVVAQLREHLFRERLMLPNPSEPELLRTMIQPDAWRTTYEMTVQRGAETTVSYLLEQVKVAVKTFLRTPLYGEQPMLPRLADMLASSARPGSGSEIPQEYLDEFKGKLARLLPANFTAQGNGPIKVLVSYPASARDPLVERYLRASISLPAGVHDYRNTDTESVSVVLLRTGMGITDVAEIRDVLRLWSGAVTWPQQTDLLPWRQRTGYDFGYLATREEHRVEILQRILCALWNGKGSVQGAVTSPDEFSIQFGDEVTIQLPLTPLTALGVASSWGSLLRAYELWSLDDDDIHRLFYVQLMRELPEGLDAQPALPHPLYMTLRDTAAGQIELLDEILKQQTGGQRARASQLRAFWAETLPAALDLPFTETIAPIAHSLRELETVVI
jgi:hypothetical protein